MMLQNRLAEQTVSQLIESILAVRFTVKTASYSNDVKSKALCAKPGMKCR